MSARFANPIRGVALGDPFVLRDRGRFYLYGTNDGPPLPDGRVVPVFRSDDLLSWEPLGGALVPTDPHADHWAPEVLAWNGRFYMVVSFGDVDRTGHALWVAVADRPEGPFHLARRVSGPSERFSIDGSWLLDDDGRLYLFRCLDFTDAEAPPHGTGIVVQPMRDPLTPSGPPITVLRAHSGWHLFEPRRTMPLYEGRTFAEWTTIEGPAPIRRGGRYYCGYSGGNYSGAYGTGEAVADSPVGPYTDLRGREGPIFGTVPGLVEGPGHFSVVRPDLIHDWIVLHGRTPGDTIRRPWLCPAVWGPGGIAVGRLTDQPQAPPPLPNGWDPSAGGGLDDREMCTPGWTPEPRGFRYDGGAGAQGVVRHPGLELAGDWAFEVAIRFPQGGPGRAAVAFSAAPGHEVSVWLPASPDRPAAINRADGPPIEAPLPFLGDEPFDVRRFHGLAVRCASGRVEVRLDGVVLAADLAMPEVISGIELRAEGPTIFDGAAWARAEHGRLV